MSMVGDGIAPATANPEPCMTGSGHTAPQCTVTCNGYQRLCAWQSLPNPPPFSHRGNAEGTPICWRDRPFRPKRWGYCDRFPGCPRRESRGHSVGIFLFAEPGALLSRCASRDAV